MRIKGVGFMAHIIQIQTAFEQAIHRTVPHRLQRLITHLFGAKIMLYTWLVPNSSHKSKHKNREKEPQMAATSSPRSARKMLVR